jgi:hypothetical protein
MMVIKVRDELGQRNDVLTDLTDHDAVRGDKDQQIHGGNGAGVGQVIVDRSSEGGV